MSDLSPDEVAIGRRLDAAIREIGITNVALSERTGINNGVISRVRRCERTTNTSHLRKMADALGIPFAWLAFGEDPDGAMRRRFDRDASLREVTLERSDPDLDALDRVIRGPRQWWPSGTTPEQLEIAIKRAKGERFKLSAPSDIPETYWFGRLQELAREVTGRAKSVHQREAVEDPADRDARELEEERARRKAAREARNKG